MNDSINKNEQNESYNLPKVIFLAFVAAIGGFLFGFDSGVINGTVDALQVAFDSDAAGTGFNVASVLLGCVVGAFFAGTLADKFGRKPIMLVAGVLFMVSAWGSGISEGSFEFVIYRLIGGLAVGAASILAPLYISEIAPSKIRGRLSTLQQLMIVIGLFAAFISNYGLVGASGGAEKELWMGFQTWQWMFWVEILPAAIFVVVLFFIPESPRYLVASNQSEKAHKVLSSINNPQEATEKVADIQSTLRTDGSRPKLKDIISKYTGKLHPLVWVGLGIAVLQQLTGINVVFYYGATLWQAAGFGEADALFINVIGGCVNIFFTILAIMLIDKLGRKPLLLIGSIGQALMLGVLAYLFATASLDEAGKLVLEGSNGTLALLAANAYIAFFSLSWGPVMWVMLGEMFPNQYRGAALAVCGIAQWGSNFIVTITFPIMLSKLGLGISYGVYAAFGFIAYFFVKLYVEETKGLSLEDISRKQEEEEKKLAKLN